MPKNIEFKAIIQVEFRMFRYLLQLFFLFIGNALIANNIRLDNVQIIEKNSAEHWANIRFDLSMDNAWRINSSASNWSAAWVFAKYRLADGIWRHATLSSLDANHTMPLHVEGDASLDGKGIFIFDNRPNIGNFNFSASGIVLRWNYGDDLVNDNENSIDIQLFGIEMVYIPTGAFYLGSGGSETNHLYTAGSNAPYFVTSENAIVINSSSGNLFYDQNNRNAGDQNGPIPVAFPKGFKAFYLMRYEISQQQYVDFLNHLTRQQQIAHVGSNISGDAVTNTYVLSNSATILHRNGIRCPANGNGTTTPIQFFCDYNGNGTGNEADDGANIACAYLSWSDLPAYYDWSGLRPYSELEFEKAARGTIFPVPYEYSWGTLNLTQATGPTFPGTVFELSSSIGNGLCNYNSSGPMRSGFSSTIITNSRLETGFSYYGIADLSGNVTERCVTIGSPVGRSFVDSNGDGNLTATGQHNVIGWPAEQGLSLRGGNFGNSSNLLRVSARDMAFYRTTLRSPFESGRGARTAE